MERLSAFFITLVDHVGYAGLFVVMALGNIGAPVGTEFVIPAAGALVATGHLSNLWLVIVVAVLGELAGASAAYAVGRFGGRPFVHRYGHYVMFHEREMAKVESFFQRYGSFAILLCRFIPVLRGICSIPAGISRMPLLPFYVFTAAGSFVFCLLLALLGHKLGQHLDDLAPLFHRFSLSIVALLLVGIAALVVTALVRRRASETR
ncbi:MAG: DedA family protein [Candidatus Eremiobacteraeota bacterium]|nr:DedA family protein [Candidatus Eremiobacteraeota bacterium]